MRFFTNKGIVQKTVIALVIVILTTFAVPKPVQADLGGKLMNPIINFIVVLFDGVQHLLEMTMLGESNTFMKDINNKATYGHMEVLEDSDGTYYVQTEENIPTITTDKFIDATFFGINSVNIPVINYTPEAIFSNQVPALDVNFISPSVKTGNDTIDKKMNIAMKLQPIIASWYSTLRIIAIVGLLSVLLYLGIRMLLTSVAADRAKYKQMLMDWIVAMCLVVTLHYIMAFAMTMAETVTAMLSSEANGTFVVLATNVDGIALTTKKVAFSSNLMSYVRFMVQAGDLHVKLAFFGLYIMLVIFSIRFTWIYLKRVVNMAFLTLIAPMVALMYPIDKASDGKAQAFDMWLKEYTYNALIQPVDLLLYKVLLGSAVELAVDNPVYAIVALGFIIAAENLVKKMFGFGKASGGTLGSLAGAAGVSAFAGTMMQNFAKKAAPGGGGNGKVRTKDVGERQGKDADANKPFAAFKDKNAEDVIGAGADVPTPSEDPVPAPGEDPAPTPGEDPVPTPGGDPVPTPGGDPVPTPDQGEDQDEGQGQGEDQDEGQGQGEGQGKDSVPTPDTWRSMMERDRREAEERKQQLRLNKEKEKNQRKLDKESGELSRKRKIKAYQAWRGIKSAAPAVAYKAARGTLKTASRLIAAGAMGTMGAIIGATTGDGDKAISMAMGAAGVGFATGDNLFEASAGKVMKDKSIRDEYGAGKYGNKIDARNARADKEYFRSEKFDDFYDKYYKGTYTKKQVQEFVQDYRKAGITSESEIRRAKKLEEHYMAQNSNLSKEDARAQVQNIIQSYKDMDMDKKAFSDEKARAKEISRIAGMLDGKNKGNETLAEQIFRGYEDWRNSAV